MRPRTRSAGKPKAPISSVERMTRLVTLSSARPRKPLTSPGASQKGRRRLAGARVASAPGADQAPGECARTSGERRTPVERATMVGNVLVVQLQRLAEAPGEAKARAVRATPQGIVLVEDHLDPRVLALGVRGQEHPQPARDFVVGAPGEHLVDSTLSMALLAASGPRAATAALAGDARHPDSPQQSDQHSLYPQERHFLHPSS